MKINVSASRMELMLLKKRVVLARRGHKLLKDKQDELIRKFMELINNYKDIRREGERALKLAYESFLVARGVLSPEVLEEALLTESAGIDLGITEESIMNIGVPKMKLGSVTIPFAYSFNDTSYDLDMSLENFTKALPWLVKLAEKERALTLLSEEIERTRRRVNALEYVLIPTLTDAIRQITVRLGEIERSALTRIMKIKDIVRAH